MKEFLKKMLWGSLCLVSVLMASSGIITVGSMVLHPLEVIKIAGGLKNLVATYGIVAVGTVITGGLAYFSGKKFNEIDIQFVDKMKKLGKWIKTGVEKVLNLVPGLSRTMNEENVILNMTEVESDIETIQNGSDDIETIQNGSDDIEANNSPQNDCDHIVEMTDFTGNGLQNEQHVEYIEIIETKEVVKNDNDVNNQQNTEARNTKDSVEEVNSGNTIGLSIS